MFNAAIIKGKHLKKQPYQPTHSQKLFSKNQVNAN